MANVKALTRGYFGGVIRETGEVFGIDDEIMDDPKRRPKWVKRLGEVAEAVDHGEGSGEGDGSEGAGETAKPKKGKGKGKPVTVKVPEAKPFEDAAAPVRAKSEINDALGTTQPDWLAPGGAPQAVTD